MCVYCMMADHAHTYWPYPYDPNPMPRTIPPTPVREWTWPQYNEFEDILRRIKALEDKVGGCPAGKDKTAFLEDIKHRLEDIDEKLGG